MEWFLSLDYTLLLVGCGGLNATRFSLWSLHFWHLLALTIHFTCWIPSPYQHTRTTNSCNQQSIKHNIRSIVEGRRLLLSISSTKMYYCPQASDYSTHTNDSQMSENIRQENIKIKIKWYLPLPGWFHIASASVVSSTRLSLHPASVPSIWGKERVNHLPKRWTWIY